MRGQHRDGSRRERWKPCGEKYWKREIMKCTQTDKRKSHRIGRWKRCSMEGREGKKWKKASERGREREREKQLSSCPSPHAARTPPWGGTQTLSPCPALYSPGNCSQINLAGYPVELSPVQCSVAPRALHTGCSFRRNAGWWRTNL